MSEQNDNDPRSEEETLADMKEGVDMNFFFGGRGKNPYHRNPLRVRSKHRKPFRSGPVIKRVPYGRCKMLPDGNWRRYT